MDFLLTLLLVVVGGLLLLLSLAGVAFGAYMALDQRTRRTGLFFALWWVPAVAAAGGVLMRDLVTFAIGVFCFIVAGLALALERSGFRRPTGDKISSDAEGHPPHENARRWLSDRLKKYRKFIS